MQSFETSGQDGRHCCHYLNVFEMATQLICMSAIVIFKKSVASDI